MTARLTKEDSTRARRVARNGGDWSPLGGVEDEQVLAPFDPPQQASAFAGLHLSGDRKGAVDPVGAQAFHLVFDERVDRIDDQRHARHEETRELVDDALPGPRLKQHHAVVLAQHVEDGLALHRAELALAKDVPKEQAERGTGLVVGRGGDRPSTKVEGRIRGDQGRDADAADDEVPRPGRDAMEGARRGLDGYAKLWPRRSGSGGLHPLAGAVAPPAGDVPVLAANGASPGDRAAAIQDIDPCQ